MTVITRFAPSPTGYLHIGSARTALFNWLFARHHGGKYFLRIEDTDKERSTDAAVDAILKGLAWLGIEHDDEPVFQSKRALRHVEVAEKLVESGGAYLCYHSQEEVQAMREEARKHGKSFESLYRDGLKSPENKETKPVVRLKAPKSGETIVEDKIMGRIVVENSNLDDMVLLRADSTPTYMLAVVVDDYDMGVTHVIRGDDHLTNTFRQAQLYKALSWEVPEFAHIPLIHGPDGTKLSKRHGALGVDAYKNMGFLPEAMNNYLLRLGFSYGDEEIISKSQAIEWFELSRVNKSPARLDFDKMKSVNTFYIKAADDQRLLNLAEEFLEETAEDHEKSLAAVKLLKERSKTIVEIVENLEYFISEKHLDNGKIEKLSLSSEDILNIYHSYRILCGLSQSDWQKEIIQENFKKLAEEEGCKLGAFGMPLRLVITGRENAPGIFEILAILGQEVTLRRLEKFIHFTKSAENEKVSDILS